MVASIGRGGRGGRRRGQVQESGRGGNNEERGAWDGGRGRAWERVGESERSYTTCPPHPLWPSRSIGTKGSAAHCLMIGLPSPPAPPRLVGTSLRGGPVTWSRRSESCRAAGAETPRSCHVVGILRGDPPSQHHRGSSCVTSTALTALREFLLRPFLTTSATLPPPLPSRAYIRCRSSAWRGEEILREAAQQMVISEDKERRHGRAGVGRGRGRREG